MAADEPLTLRRLATVAGLADPTAARRLVQHLQTLYDQDGTAFQVEELAGGFQLLTRPQFHPWLTRLRRVGSEMRLTAAARNLGHCRLSPTDHAGGCRGDPRRAVGRHAASTHGKGIREDRRP